MADMIPDDEWEIVSETRSTIIFDEDGDQFTGTWEGFENVTDPNTGEQYLYANLRNGETGPVCVSASYQLEKGLKNVPVGKRVRITRTGTTDLGKGRHPMINYRIEVARR